MSKYSNPLLLFAFIAIFASCEGDFIQQEDFNPSFGGDFKLLEGRFSVLDLFHLDSIPSSNNQIITIENTLSDDLIDFSPLIPEDSLYTTPLNLLSSSANFEIADHSYLTQSISQIQFIQSFATADFSLFNTNNGNSIAWSGCSSFSNYYFGSVIVPEVFDEIRIDSGLYDITLVNNLDFDVTIGIALKSNPSILFSQVVTIGMKDSVMLDTLVLNTDANASYNWTIYQVSSPGIPLGSTSTIDNSNLFELKVRRSNCFLSSGKFRPVSNVLADLNVNLPLPLERADKFNYVEANDIDLTNLFQANGLGSTSLQLYRTITDAGGTLFSDVIYVISNPQVINWVAAMSNTAIQPVNGKVEVHYELKSLPNAIIEINPSKSIVINHGFTTAPDIVALGFNEDWLYSFSTTTEPYGHWPEELQLNFTPLQSSIKRTLSHLGWGDVTINSEFQNHIGTFAHDSLTINLGSTFLDSSVNASMNWSLNGFSVNSFNALTPDSLTATTSFNFKAPWGVRMGNETLLLSEAELSLNSNNGTALLRSEKKLELSDNGKLDSLIASCDSISAYAVVRSKTTNAVVNSTYLTNNVDTIIALRDIYLNTNDSVTSIRRNIENFEELNSKLNFSYQADFANPAIQLNTQDSLFLDIYLNFNGLP